MKKLTVLIVLIFCLWVMPARAYDLQGTITAAGTGLGNIPVSLSGQAFRSELSSSNGSFVFKDLSPGTYTITPAHSNWVFFPASSTCTIVDADITDAAFTAAKTQLSLKILSPKPGLIKSNGTVNVQLEVSAPFAAQIRIVLYKETRVGTQIKQEPWYQAFIMGTTYSYKDLTPGTYTLMVNLLDMFRLFLPAEDRVTFRLELDTWNINPIWYFSASSNNDSIRLKWQNPATDMLKGNLILRSTSPITDTPATGTIYNIGNTIGSATVVYRGTGTTYQTWWKTYVDDYSLSPNTTYYYAIFTYNQEDEYSPPTNSSVTLSNTPPAKVTTLYSKSHPTDHSITLDWIAPGGDELQGLAASYTVKYATHTISKDNFDSCSDAPGIVPNPSEVGSLGEYLKYVNATEPYMEHMVVLVPDDVKKPFSQRTIQPETEYWFALKAWDGMYWSEMSNVFSMKTSDDTPPGTISDLAIVSPKGNSVMLAWTAPGDDLAFTWEKDASGRADVYDIRYSTFPLTEATWAYARMIPKTTPGVAGAPQVALVSGLSLDKEEYFFGIKTIDEDDNQSALSNVVAMDRMAPAAITDVKIVSFAASTLELSWTAPGDNGLMGTATSYDIRYSLSPITEATWPACTEVWNEPKPAAAGTLQRFIVEGLTFNTRYYLAMKVIDKVGNASPLSNCTCGTTTGQFPDPPTNLTAIGEDSRLILTWSPSTIPDLGGYLIYYGTVSCAGTTNKQAYYQPVDVGKVCQYTLTGLENETTYYLSIRAYNTNHYPGEHGIEITGEPVKMGYQFLPQSVIIPMGGQQANPTDSPLELDRLRNAYKAVFAHIKEGGNVEWTAGNSMPYDGTNYLRGTFISEFSPGTGSTLATATAMGTLTGFDMLVTRPGEGLDKVLGVSKSYSLVPVKIALFYGTITDQYGQAITWEEGYFERLFRMYLWDTQEFTRVNEAEIKEGALSNYDMVIFPAVKRGYMDRLRDALGQEGLNKIQEFVSAGGVFYSQGESNYIAEMVGLVKQGTVDINNRVSISNNIGQFKILDETCPTVFARLSDSTYILDDPTLTEQGTQTIIARYSNVAGSPAAIVCADYGRGEVILMGGHPSEKREFYPLVLNAVLWAMGRKAAILCDGEQRLNKELGDLIPGLETDVPVYVTASFSNFWNEALQQVEVISIVQKGFKITDASNIIPPTTPESGTDGTTILKWTFPEVGQGRLTFCYTVFTQADALKEGEAVVCETRAVYTDRDKQVTIWALPVKMEAKMAARLVGYRYKTKHRGYGLPDTGLYTDVRLPLENKENTEARQLRIQDLVALVSPAIDPLNYQYILSSVWNTNNGTNHCVWVQNEIYFYGGDSRYPMPDGVSGRLNIYNWDGKTTYVFEQPEGIAANIVVPERYQKPVWGPGKNVPLIQKTANGDLILPACKLVWSGLGKGEDAGVMQGYDFLDPAIRYGFKSTELPPDGVGYSRTVLMRSDVSGIPENYQVSGSVIMDTDKLGFVSLLGQDPIPYREVLTNSDPYVPLPTNPEDMTVTTFKDIWNRPQTATVHLPMDISTVTRCLPKVKLNPIINDTFELFEDTNDNDIRDAGERLFLEYDISKKAKLHIQLKTGCLSTEFPEVVKPVHYEFDVHRDQSAITYNLFKGLGYNIEYGHYKCDDLQGVGNPTQLVKEFDTPMFHTLQFQQRLDAGKHELIHVYATMTTYPRVHKEGVMKVNDGSEYVYRQLTETGPDQYQMFNAHVQAVFGLGNNVKIAKKVAPTNIDNYGDTIYHIIKVEDPYEPRPFDQDPYLCSYGFGDLAATIFVGGREKDKLLYSSLKPGEGTIVRIEICNNMGVADNGQTYHLKNVSIEPDMNTVPEWMTITKDVLLNSSSPEIPGDLEFLLMQQDYPSIWETSKGVIYFRVETKGTISESDRGKIHKIKFKLTCDEPADKLAQYINLTKSKTIIPEAWIGIYDDQGRVMTTFGKADIVTLKDNFPEFVKVEKAKLMTEEEKEVFVQKIGRDVDQPVRGTTSAAYFDSIGANRDISVTQAGSEVVFNMSSIKEPAVEATTIPWKYNGKETRAFYVVVKSNTKEVGSGIKTVNAGANIEYKDHFNNTGSSTSKPQEVTVHGPNITMGYILEGVRRGFNQRLTNTLVMDEENIVEVRVARINEGDNIARSNEIEVTLAENVKLVRTEPPYDSTDGRVVKWGYLGDLAPGEVRNILLYLAVTPGTATVSPGPSPWSNSLWAREQDPFQGYALANSDGGKSMFAQAPPNTGAYVMLIGSSTLTFMDPFSDTQITPDPLGSFTIAAALPPLTAPQNLKAETGTGSLAGMIILSWTRPNHTGTVAGYNLYRRQSQEGAYTLVNLVPVPATATIYQDTTLDQDIPYYYVATAVSERFAAGGRSAANGRSAPNGRSAANSEGEESSYSGSATAKPIDIWPPGAITSLTAATTFESIELSWVSPGDNGYKGTVTAYELRYTSSNQAWDSATPVSGLPINTPAGSQQQLTISGLVPDTQYRVYLVARDEVGHSSTSTIMAATRPVFTEKTVCNLYAGYNLVSLPLKPVGTYTVGSLCNEVKKKGGKILTVQRWTAMGWQTFVPGNPATIDFPMKIGEGCFVQAKDRCSFELSGYRIYTQSIELAPGWNLMGLPVKGTVSGKGLGTLTSISLLKEINAYGGQGTIATVLQKWEGGWLVPAKLDLEFIQAMHFPLYPDKGYFVFVTDKTTYSPNRIRVSNITETGVNISWLTDEEVTGKINYGVKGGPLNNTGFDERSEEIRDDTHYVTIKGLTPNTTYWYDLISGGTVDDNNGQHYIFKTAAPPPAPGPAAAAVSPYQINGRVLKSDGYTPGEGVIVYLRLEDNDGAPSKGCSAWLSALTDSSGVWKIELTNVRTEDLTAGFSYSTAGDNLVIEVEGGLSGRGKLVLDTSQASTPDMGLK